MFVWGAHEAFDLCCDEVAVSGGHFVERARHFRQVLRLLLRVAHAAGGFGDGCAFGEVEGVVEVGEWLAAERGHLLDGEGGVESAAEADILLLDNPVFLFHEMILNGMHRSFIFSSSCSSLLRLLSPS